MSGCRERESGGDEVGEVVGSSFCRALEAIVLLEEETEAGTG